jgi:hypothetical protein
MLLCRRPLLFTSDLLGAAGIALICGAVGMGVIGPWQAALASRPSLTQNIAEADIRYGQSTQRNQALAAIIRQHERAVAELAGRRRTDPGDFLEFVSDRCARHGIRLLQMTPQNVAASEAQRAWDAQWRAAGPFPAFPRLLSDMEEWSPFVEVRELSVTGPPAGADADCQFSWTVRVSAPAATPREPQPPADTTEGATP